MIKAGFAILVISILMLLLYLYRFTNRAQATMIILISYALMITAYLGGSYYYYNTANSQHFFDPYYQVSPPKFKVPYIKEANEYRIIAIGGSTTRDPRKKEEENYPFLLQQLLQAKFPDKKITVLNGGMNWYCSKHSLMFYTEYAQLFHPDLVLVMDGINDVYRSFSPRDFAIGEFQPDYRHFYGASIHGAAPVSLEHSIFHAGQEDLTDYKKTKFPFSDFLAFNSFRQFETSLTGYIQADGAKCMLIMQPSIYQSTISDSVEKVLWFGKSLCNRNSNGQKTYPDAASMKTAMDSFVIAVKTISFQQNCLLLNADSGIPKTLSYFNDDVHYTSTGDSLLAQLVFNKIISAGIIR